MQVHNKLTIYSASGHLIQKFSKGTNFIPLLKSVDISSIVVIDANGSIVPFSYIPETTVGIPTIERETGERVEASVLKEGSIVNGKILTLGVDSVMLVGDNQITNIRDYDMLTIANDEDITKPRLIIERNSIPFTISYLLNSISWKCIATVLIDSKKNLLNLRLSGHIINHTEDNIQAEISLVAGHVKQNRLQPKAYLSSSSKSAQDVSTSMLEDYFKYSIGDKLIHTEDIAEIGAWVLPVTKLYIHKIDDNNIVRFGYRFIAADYVPPCSVNAYAVDNQEIGSYLGSTELEESRPKEETDLVLGESNMLRCNSTVIISNDIIIKDDNLAKQFNISSFKYNPNGDNWHIITEDIQVDITNYNTSPSLLVIKHYVGDKLLIDTKCRSYKKRLNGYLEWYFEVAPRTSNGPFKDTFKCQVVTKSYF